MSYLARLTPTGLAALAAAEVGPALALTTLAVGDADGAPYTPTGDEIALVNELAEVEIDSVEIDPTNPQQLVITAVIPAEVGGFVIREACVKMAAGLFAIANVPATTKPAPSDDGAALDMIVVLKIAFSGTAHVTVEFASLVYATREWVWATRHFFAVKSATVLAPPAEPAPGDHYLLPAGATEAWAGQAGKIAIWRNGVDGWLFVTAPDGSLAQAADSPMSYRRTDGAWAEIKPSPASKLFLHANCL